MRSGLVLAVKLAISAGGVYVVFSNINLEQLLHSLDNVVWGYLILAFIFFCASKFFSAIRLNVYFRDIGLLLSLADNTKLYLLGMFYNLFLPGGIGGDGYKVWLLHKARGFSYRKLSAAVLLDRISGMTVIIVILLILMLGFPQWGTARILSPLVALLVIVGYYIAVGHIFPYFSSSIRRTTNLSLLVQMLQIASVLFIMLALGVHSNIFGLTFIFLVSSVAAVLPISIGGIGIRELVFLYGSDLLLIDGALAVAISVLFFAITALVSLSGFYYSIHKISIAVEHESITY